MILVIDNYDSFVHNLARYFRLLGCQVEVRRNDQITLDEIQDRIEAKKIQLIVLSPGPCTPNEAGICLNLVRQLHQQIPILGVCLGHQVIAQALGGQVVEWHQPIHGQADFIHHDQQHEFEGVENPFPAARYHSLVVQPDALPPCLEVSAWLSDQTIMAIRHKQLPIVGFQFHPESILTQPGLQLLLGFLEFAKILVDRTSVDQRLSEWTTLGIDRELTCPYPLGAMPKPSDATQERP